MLAVAVARLEERRANRRLLRKCDLSPIFLQECRNRNPGNVGCNKKNDAGSAAGVAPCERTVWLHATPLSPNQITNAVS